MFDSVLRLQGAVVRRPGGLMEFQLIVTLRKFGNNRFKVLVNCAVLYADAGLLYLREVKVQPG